MVCLRNNKAVTPKPTHKILFLVFIIGNRISYAVRYNKIWTMITHVVCIHTDIHREVKKNFFWYSYKCFRTSRLFNSWAWDLWVYIMLLLVIMAFIELKNWVSKSILYIHWGSNMTLLYNRMFHMGNICAQHILH